MRKTDLKRLVKLETKRIYKIGFPKENVPLIIVRIGSFLSKNNRFYRVRLLKAWRFYSFYKEKLCLWLLSKFYWFRVYNKYSLLINTQLGRASLGEDLVFIHKNVILTRNAIIAGNVTFLGDNCLTAGKYSNKNKSNSPILGDRVWMGCGSIARGVFIANDCFSWRWCGHYQGRYCPGVPCYWRKSSCWECFWRRPSRFWTKMVVNKL